MAYNSTTWSPETLTKASETTSQELNNATLSGTLTVSGATQLNSTLTIGVDDTGYDVKFFGATSGSFMLWDESDDALELTDSTPIKIGDGGDMQIYHNGSHSFITNSTGTMNLATENSGIAVSIGHTTSETTVNDNLTVTGILDITDVTAANNYTGDTGALRCEGGGSIAKNLYVGTDFHVDGIAYLDDTDIDGTLVVDGSNISLDSTSTLNIDNSNTSNGITIGTATSGVPISIGHTTSETTVNDNLTVTGDLKLSSNVIKASDGGSTITLDTHDNIWIGNNLIVGGNIVKASDGGNTITMDTSDNVTIGNNLKVGGNVIQASDGGNTITMDTSDNVTIAGDLTVTGGDIDLSGEASQITLIDNATGALQIGSDGALDLFKLNTSDGGPTIQINSAKGQLYANLPTLKLTETAVVTGDANDASPASITLDANYMGSHTVTRHNYMVLENPNLTNTTLTNACVFSFDANAGTHKAIDSGSAHPDIDTTDAWMKININGTVYYIPCYTDKS
tara:strand:+ start:4079 stop:5608 length:1530 start_codon:yes stop_codon:yes gene_type:complete